MLETVIRRPIGASFIAIALAVLGAMALRQLPIGLLPPVTLPVLTVRADKPGAAALELEEQVLQPLEESLGTVPGLVGLEGRAAAGAVEVQVILRANADIESITNRLRERLGTLRLPQGTEPPKVLRFDPAAEPVLRLVLEPIAGGNDLATLEAAARDALVPQIEGLAEVAAVRLRGGRESEVRIVPDPARLAATGRTIADLESAVKGAVSSKSVGTVYSPEGTKRVRVRGSINRPEDLPNALVAPGVRVGDIATVEQILEEPEELAVGLLNNRAAAATGEVIMIEIMAQADAGLVAASDAALARILSLATATVTDGQTTTGVWRYAGGRLGVLTDRAAPVRSALKGVRDAALEGAVLAFAVLIVFLRSVRPSLIVFVAVPLSVVVTFLVMAQCGVSLNLMSLGGLALGIGRLVDDAIVVVESVARVREEHHDDAKDYRRTVSLVATGVREVAPAVIASTLTTIAVFVPLAFLPGVLGALFFDQAFTVSISLMASLVVALGLVPALLALPALVVGRQPPLSWPPVHAGNYRQSLRNPLLWPPRALWLALTGARWLLVNSLRLVLLVLYSLWRVVALLGYLYRPIDWLFGAAIAAIERGYALALATVVRAPGLGLVGFVVALVAGLASVRHLPQRLMPPSLSTRFVLAVELPRGRTVNESSQWARTFLADLRQRQPGLEAVALSGEAQRYAPSLTRRQDYELSLVVTLPATAADAAAEQRWLHDLEHRAMVAGAVSAAASVPPLVQLGMANSSALETAIRGPDADLLHERAIDYTARMRAWGCRGVRTSATTTADEVLVVPDSGKLLEAGLTLDQLVAAIASAADVEEITGFIPRLADGTPASHTLPIRVRGSLRDAPADSLLALNLRTADKPLPLSSVATITRAPGDGLVVHRNGMRIATLQAEALPPGVSVGALLARLQAEAPLPPGYDLVTTGVEAVTSDSLNAMGLLLLLSVFLVLVVMAVQFESVSQPLLVILAVPMAAAGAFPALYAAGHGLDVMSGIGLVMLVGVSVSNAIVLVSTVNLRREEGLPLREAVLKAGHERLRPILMTTLTTVLGLIPLALGFGEAAELRAPLAVAVMGGMISSTILVLLSLPSVLVLVGRKS